MTHYEELFIKETGKQVWIPIWSEKFKTERHILNIEYVEWFDNYMNKLLEIIDNTLNSMKRKTTTYEKSLFDYVSDLTNRSMGQTASLYELCNFDFNLLCRVEEKLKNTFNNYCPSTKEEVDYLLSLEDKTTDYNFDKLTKERKSKLFKLEQDKKELEDKLNSFEKNYTISKKEESKKRK
jgi:hypothetical protein